MHKLCIFFIAEFPERLLVRSIQIGCNENENKSAVWAERVNPAVEFGEIPKRSFDSRSFSGIHAGNKIHCLDLVTLPLITQVGTINTNMRGCKMTNTGNVGTDERHHTEWVSNAAYVDLDTGC